MKSHHTFFVIPSLPVRLFPQMNLLLLQLLLLFAAVEADLVDLVELVQVQ